MYWYLCNIVYLIIYFNWNNWVNYVNKNTITTYYYVLIYVNWTELFDEYLV